MSGLGAASMLAALTTLTALTALTAPRAARADEGEGSAAPPPEEEPLEVHVVGERGPPVAKRDPSGASTVIREERLHAPGATAAAVLAEVPGVQMARAGAGSDLSTASIRGATSAETPVYLAGVRINDDVTGTADLSLVPLWMLNRVEVYRSGAPAEADRMGIGGAIFFEPILPRATKVGAGAQVGSFGERALWVAGSAGDERAGAMIALRRQEAENNYPYLTIGGPALNHGDSERLRSNADYATFDLWSIGRFRAGRASITAIANGVSRDQGIPDYVYAEASAARSHTQRWLGALSTSVPCAEDDRCQVELATSVILTRMTLRDPAHELGLLAYEVASAGDRVSGLARLRYRWSDMIAIGLSASQEMEGLRVDRLGVSRTHTERAQRATTRASAFMLASPLPAVELNALGAIEHHATRASGHGAVKGADGTLEPTLRAGVRLKLREGLDLLTNVGRYVRVPTLGETYGTSHILRGNSALEPEHGVTFDVGSRVSASFRHADVYADLFGFARFIDNMVGFRRSSFYAIRPYNLKSARILGIELQAGAQLFDFIRAGIAFTAIDPRDVSPDRTITNDLLPNLSPLFAVPQVEFISGPVRSIALERASVGVRLICRGPRITSPGGLIVLPTQAPLDIDAALLFWKGRIAVRGALNNIFDTLVYDTIGFPLPGRSMHASLEVWW